MGLFSLVLHTHLPYVRRNGVWPCGEDFFHQAAAESYLPLLATFERLAERGLRDALTLGVTPLVAHQMQDPHLLDELHGYLARYELRALRQVANYREPDATAVHGLAGFYARFAREQAARLASLPDGIAAGFAGLATGGFLELLGGPATHPYLPLLREPALVRAQVALGLAEAERVLGIRPRGMWLPECAYRPDADPPLEEVLAEHGISHTVVDGPTMLRAGGQASLFRPQRIGASPVAAFGRNLEATYRVWSPTGGYPGDPWYRDFHHYDLEAGFKNWRVTDRGEGRPKRPYDPQRARARAAAHAEEFAGVVTDTLDVYERETGEEGILVACYDTELFGHWWFEGPEWLEQLYSILAETRVQAVSLGAALERLPPAGRLALPEGSWGHRKDDRSWVGPETAWMWDALTGVEQGTMRLARLAASNANGAGSAGAVRAGLDQLLREALLLQSSDWPFMVLRGRNATYAHERFRGHLDRWQRLARLLDKALGAPSPGAGPGAGPAAGAERLARAAARLYEIDNPFPSLEGIVI